MDFEKELNELDSIERIRAIVREEIKLHEEARAERLRLREREHMIQVNVLPDDRMIRGGDLQIRWNNPQNAARQMIAYGVGEIHKPTFKERLIEGWRRIKLFWKR